MPSCNTFATPPLTRAHVITGTFGAGKTTAIRWLMSHKPENELWVVILNEFTDAGLDALSVAEVARGDYDVRLVSGGCLCCVGELEFGKQLRDILRSLKPTRLLIEPSGAGHAADIVDELAAYEGQRAMTLDSVIGLVDALDATRLLAAGSGNEWSQIQSADILLLTKPDLAGEPERRAFAEIAALQFPTKQYVGECRHGALPPEALESYARAPAFSLLPPLTAATAPSTPSGTMRSFDLAGATVTETTESRLGLWAVSWILPPQLTVARVILEPRLTWLLDAHQSTVKRLKAVLRTGPGPSWLIQSHGRGLDQADSAHRRDSRIELVLTSEPTPVFLDAWRAVLHDATH